MGSKLSWISRVTVSLELQWLTIQIFIGLHADFGHKKDYYKSKYNSYLSTKVCDSTVYNQG